MSEVTSKRDLMTMPFEQALDAYSPNFSAELPDHIPVEKFKRTIITSLNLNPDLRRADRRSLFNAAVKCAHDGLYPDGREAAFVVRGGKAVYMPMIAGIRKRMRNSGEILSATAEVVYRGDTFRYWHGENPGIEHAPPPLGQDRGEAIGAYAVIKLTNGETLREVMSKAEIEKVRSVSPAKSNGPWVDWWPEMARKTVLRRCAKQAPTDSELERLLARDDERTPGEETEAPPRPTREQFIEHEPERPYVFTDLDGEVHEHEHAASAIAAVRAILAAQTEPAMVEAMWENTEALRRAITEPELLVSLTDSFRSAANPARPMPEATQFAPQGRALVSPSEQKWSGGLPAPGEGYGGPANIGQEAAAGAAAEPPHGFRRTKAEIAAGLSIDLAKEARALGIHPNAYKTPEPASQQPPEQKGEHASDADQDLSADRPETDAGDLDDSPARELDNASDIGGGRHSITVSPKSKDYPETYADDLDDGIDDDPPARRWLGGTEDGHINRLSMEIAMPTRDGQPWHEAWVKTLLLPAIRRQTDAVDLAHLIGDNDAHIQRLPAHFKAQVDGAMNAQYDVIAKGRVG